MKEYLDAVNRVAIRELHREIEDSYPVDTTSAPVQLLTQGDDLAYRYALAKRHTIENATEMDLVQYLVTRPGRA